MKQQRTSREVAGEKKKKEVKKKKRNNDRKTGEKGKGSRHQVKN